MACTGNLADYRQLGALQSNSDSIEETEQEARPQRVDWLPFGKNQCGQAR